MFRWISAALVACAAARACALPETVASLTLSSDGLSADVQGAAVLRFARPLAAAPSEVKRVDARTLLFTGSSPDKARIRTLAPGIELRFPGQMELLLDGGLQPRLSWQDASAAPGVPTPPTTWALLSFGARQPPVLLLSPEPLQYRLDELGDAFTLRTLDEQAGWVRFVLPFGLRPRPAATAAELGRLIAELEPELPWLSQPPNYMGLRFRTSEELLEGVFSFSGPGGLLRPQSQLARAVGSKGSARGSFFEMPGGYRAGPLAISRKAEYQVAFPLMQASLGRPLSVGPAPAPPSTVSSFDVPGMVELAMSLASSAPEPLWVQTAEDTLAEDSQSAGEDVRYARALLQASLARAANGEAPAEAAPQWMVELLYGDIAWSAERQRTAYLARVYARLAGSFRDVFLSEFACQAVEAQVGLRFYRKRLGLQASGEPALQAMDALNDPAAWIYSPVRVLGAVRAQAVETGPLEYRLTWEGPLLALYDPWSLNPRSYPAARFGPILLLFGSAEGPNSCDVRSAIALPKIPVTFKYVESSR